MTANPFIQLRSDKFPILPGEEDELLNDGVFGKALSEYLRERLIERGYDSPFVCCEDWGWWVELKGQPFTLGLCVYGFPFDDDETLDLCVRVSEDGGRRWSWTRFRMIDRTARVEQLHSDVLSILEADDDVAVIQVIDDFPPLGEEL